MLETVFEEASKAVLGRTTKGFFMMTKMFGIDVAQDPEWNLAMIMYKAAKIIIEMKTFLSECSSSAQHEVANFAATVSNRLPSFERLVLLCLSRLRQVGVQ